MIVDSVAAEGQGAVPIVAPTVGNDAMEARSDMSGAVPCQWTPRPQAREEDAAAPLAQSRMEEESEARACNCSLCGEARTHTTFDPAGNIGHCVERFVRSNPQASAAASAAAPLVRPREEEARAFVNV